MFEREETTRSHVASAPQNFHLRCVDMAQKWLVVAFRVRIHEYFACDWLVCGASTSGVGCRVETLSHENFQSWQMRLKLDKKDQRLSRTRGEYKAKTQPLSRHVTIEQDAT